MSVGEPLVVVLYGAPGTGKTTLLEMLRERAHDKFHFVTVVEPTNSPEIVALLQQMYEQSEADIRAGRSVTLRTQAAIMRARFAAMRAVAANYPWDLLHAVAHRKRLVYVCDGHPLSDAALYARAKFDSHEMTTAEFAWYLRELASELQHFELSLLCTPQLFLKLHLEGDTDGSLHYHRVFTLRQTEAERNVPPSVYKHLAEHANSAHKHIACPGTRHASLDTWNHEPVAVWTAFVNMLLSDQLADQLVPSAGPAMPTGGIGSPCDD